MINYHVITLFPEAFESYIGASIIRRAIEKKKISVKFYNPRDFAISANPKRDMTYAERRVDDRPYGGGPGMVLEALPVIRAIEKAVGKKVRNVKLKKNVKILFFSPEGEQFSNAVADSWKKISDIVLVCGRYEGIDARIKKVFKMSDVTVGPYILTGGEIPAMIVIDAITRRLDGVLGDIKSIEEQRVASRDVYTRPPAFEYKKKKYRVPKVLLGGNHKEIDEWKKSLF